MTRRGVWFVLPIATALVTIAAAQQSGTSTKPAKGSESAVQEITLPNVPMDMPPGPNLAVYQQKCLLCHTSRYVSMQPHFSRTVWEKEVKKMVDVYGAPITPEEQQQIVEYLVAIKGPAESK
jgi:cytochrome c5